MHVKKIKKNPRSVTKHIGPGILLATCSDDCSVFNIQPHCKTLSLRRDTALAFSIVVLRGRSPNDLKLVRCLQKFIKSFKAVTPISTPQLQTHSLEDMITQCWHFSVVLVSCADRLCVQNTLPENDYYLRGQMRQKNAQIRTALKHQEIHVFLKPPKYLFRPPQKQTQNQKHLKTWNLQCCAVLPV